jgi:DNA modification methylase
MNHQVFHGNNIDTLKSYPDNHFDSVVTDPPYGLGKEPDAAGLMKSWVEHGYHEIKGKGFMGKEWDAFVPQPLFWKEVFRVLKPGGHVLAFYGTRTYDWGVMAMRFAGFEIRDCIQWLYGSGFPKSHNVSKSIDKIQGVESEVVGQYQTDMGGLGGTRLGEAGGNITRATGEDAKKWDGWGTALKPANEPIVLARKPLEEGESIASNVLKWGAGALNIDKTRVELKTGEDTSTKPRKAETAFVTTKSGLVGTMTDKWKMGRWPANMILGHHPECKCIGLKKIQVGVSEEAQNIEILEDWDCHDDCPVKIIDKQSSELSTFEDVNASRFFYVCKPNGTEKDFGLEEFTKENIHPTVKPVQLMQYLVKMVTPPGGLVLDPFCGSGTTGIACKLEGFSFVGLEQDETYYRIASTRIEKWQPEMKDRRFLTIKEVYEPNQLKLF